MVVFPHVSWFPWTQGPAILIYSTAAPAEQYFSVMCFWVSSSTETKFSHLHQELPWCPERRIVVLRAFILCSIPSQKHGCKISRCNWRSHVIKSNRHLQQFGAPSPIGVRGSFCPVAMRRRESRQPSGQLWSCSKRWSPFQQDTAVTLWVSVVTSYLSSLLWDTSHHPISFRGLLATLWSLSAGKTSGCQSCQSLCSSWFPPIPMVCPLDNFWPRK